MAVLVASGLATLVLCAILWRRRGDSPSDSQDDHREVDAHVEHEVVPVHQDGVPAAGRARLAPISPTGIDIDAIEQYMQSGSAENAGC
jgi:hypothetical protein